MVITSESDEEEVHSKRRWDKVKEHLISTKSRAKQDIVRLFGLLIVLIPCIVLIGLEIQAEFFMPIVTLVVGIIIESPLTARSTK